MTSPTGSRATLVIVDDDEGHLELLRRNLRRVGARNPLVMITSGAEALDYVFARGAHAGRGDTELVMLLDINMPGGVDGVEVLRQIKSDPRTRTVPIIMLTTTDDPREVERCHQLGCNAYVTMPVDAVAYVEAIQRIWSFVAVARVPVSPGGLAP